MKSSGESHYCAKLSWPIVAKIRREYATGKATYKKLSEKYGVSCGSIGQVVHHKSWVKK